MNGRNWFQGRVVWERMPGAPPPARRVASSRLARAAALLALSLVVVVAGCTSAPPTGTATSTSSAGSEKAAYKIGAILSLTGTYAGLGAPEKNVIDMEVARINAAGGVNGHKIDVVIEDDATDNGKAVTAATKLIDQDKVLAILGSSGTGETMAIRSEIDRAGIPNVSMAGGNAITAMFDKNVFQTPWNNALVVPVELAYMKSKGITKIGVISDSGGFGKDGLAIIETDVAKFGITITDSELFNPGDTDMTSQLTKIKNSGAQEVLMWTAGAEAATIAKNMVQLKMTIPLMGSHGNARQQFIDGAGSAAEGFTFAAGKILVPSAYGVGTDEYKVAMDFIDRYSKMYGKKPDTFAGHAYDALNITVDAMKALPEGFTAAQLRDQIEKTTGFVGIGGKFTYSPTDHSGMTASDLVMYKVQGGTWTLVK
jgi:branched-chain amino acid transport system substrate-binding protein